MASQKDELDFRSKSFNPEKLFSATEIQLPDPNAKEYENMQSLREEVHSQTFNVVRELPGVLGPGGIPKPQTSASTERRFTEDQGPLQGRGPRRLRNVINRMEEIRGPLAVLRRCMEEDIRVKVYTRNHSEVRSVLTGFVVAFDKHWNLALRDVDEVFQKKIQCKKHALGDVSRYLNVGDMSIQDDHEDADSDSEDEQRQSKKPKDPCPSWVAATTWGARISLENAQSGSRMTAAATRYHSHDSRTTGLGGGGLAEGQGGSEGPLDTMEERALGSRRVSGLYPDTSEARDALKLQLGQAGEQGGEGKGDKAKKRRRKRKTKEIRKRHVNQLLVRGENVVLVAVMQP